VVLLAVAGLPWARFWFGAGLVVVVTVDLLDYAYIGGRYDANYRISKEDLEILVIDVKKLLKLTEEVCKKKIQSFTKN
jgi:hypothetical protein